MTVEFKVVVDLESLNRSGNGMVTGGIYVQVGEHCFPEEGWNDFPLLILRWWIEGIREWQAGRSADCMCRFMDGPFSFHITGNRQSAQLSFLKDSATLMAFDEVALSSVFGEFLRAANALCDECLARKWSTVELAELLATLGEVKSTNDSR